MKEEKFFELIGEIDEQKIKAAEAAPKKKGIARIIRTGLYAAACAVLIIGAGAWLRSYRSTDTDSALERDESDTSDENIIKDDSETAIALEYDDISIYYLKDGEIQSETEYLPCDPKEIFEVWKEKNRIGEEVKLINVKIEDNGTEKSDSLIASYTVGDYFIYNLTVTESLKSYFEVIPKEELEKSLKLTLTSYDDMKYDEFNVIYK